MALGAAAASQNFPSVCRQWRQYRKLSQLDLALAAEISQRHMSWLETGRSRPSREMVIRLSDALDIPLRERNVLLQSAGFAAAYNESRLDEPTMAPVLEALNHVLEHHEPFPAVVVDRFWNIRKKNRAADLILGIDGDPEALLRRIGAGQEINLALLTLHPQGLRPYISNWQQAAPAFIRRLKCEALATGDAKVQQRFAEFIELADLGETDHPVDASLLPVLPLELKIGDLELSLFTVISTFGTPQDITTDELRIETFYPTNTVTEKFFRSMA
ncbi:MAG TPA: helix-turn-helix transcriptional regulator [Xanthomonadales bacterium]|nr:helix-turn-helix transcriptional regulator [Xanthomonadales bacterium]